MGDVEIEFVTWHTNEEVRDVPAYVEAHRSEFEEWFASRTIELLRAQKIREIEREYRRAVYAPIEHDGHVWQADQESHDILVKVITVAPDGWETYWLDAQNTPVKMTKSDLLRLAEAILDRGQALFSKKQALKSAVRKSADFDQIKWEETE